MKKIEKILLILFAVIFFLGIIYAIYYYRINNFPAMFAKKEFNSLKEKEPNHRRTLDVYILYEFPDMAYTTKRSYPTPDIEEYIQEIYDNSYQYEDD